MNRAHQSSEAQACIREAQDAGFDNLTVDLIYGAPTTTGEQWATNLQLAFGLRIPHLSCYCLTVEEKTALAHFIKTGKTRPVDEEQAARQFEVLMDLTAMEGYEHYEISNFALPGHYSRHNTSYWQGKKYLGIGPSAHSFDGTSRQWNVANNARYIRTLKTGEIPFERELLTPGQRYNEYVMTALRTMWGCDFNEVTALGYAQHFTKSIQQHLTEGHVEQSGHVFRLTRKGKLLADGIAADLFFP